MMRRLLPLVLVALVLLVVIPCQTYAQEDVSVSHAVEVDFPTALTFSVSAESPDEIDRIVLRYRVEKVTAARLTSLVLMRFEPSYSVETSWTWDMRKASLPPGAVVHYSWRIEDAGDRRVETDWETVRFDDNGHSWASLSEGNVTLLWYHGNEGFARGLMDSAQGALGRLADDTGAHLTQGVEVYVYANADDVKEALVFSQEWLGGIAFPEYGIVAIGVAPEDLSWGKRIVKHELAHLVTHQMTANPYSGIPTWLDEGLSMYAEGALEFYLAELLGEAVAEDRLFSVRTLSSEFPSDPQGAYLSYAQSFSLVDFLLRTYGKEDMRRLLETFEHGATYDDALWQVYGFDTAGLDAMWRDSLGLTPSLPTPTGTPDPGFMGCGATEAEGTHSAMALFGVLGLVLLPGTGEVLRLTVRRGGR